MAPHIVAEHEVSPVKGLSPAGLVVPAGQAVHDPEDTCWLAEHVKIAEHEVSDPPIGSSPAVLLVPTAQAVHVPDDTYSSVAQLQRVSDPVESSPATLVLPEVHAVHVPDVTL